jgi:hypothetical protein
VDSVVAKRPIEELINFACSLSKVYRHFKFEFSIAGGVGGVGVGETRSIFVVPCSFCLPLLAGKMKREMCDS